MLFCLSSSDIMSQRSYLTRLPDIQTAQKYPHCGGMPRIQYFLNFQSLQTGAPVLHTTEVYFCKSFVYALWSPSAGDELQAKSLEYLFYQVCSFQAKVSA